MSVKRILVGNTQQLTQKEKDTALMEASEYGYTDIARVLIKAGANVNAKNKYGETALVIAYQSQPDDDMAELLREYGGTDGGYFEE
jgi:ankyrin repeat protein